mgnify:CR=1 FL=1
MFDPDKRRSNTTFLQVSLSISLVLAISEKGVKGGERQDGKARMRAGEIRDGGSVRIESRS